MATEVQDFAAKVQSLLHAADREPKWAPAEAERFMAEWAPRRQKFDEVAARLMSQVIRPRMDALAGLFPQARLTKLGPNDRCACWFRYTSRFPANVKVELSVEHDATFEHVVIHSELYVVPAFIKYDHHDKLSLPADQADEQAVAAWVEERLLGAVEIYLQLDRGAEDFDDEPVTDPVCGMRIQRSSAAAEMDYRGHPYFFCAEACRAQFAADPERYVQVVTD